MFCKILLNFECSKYVQHSLFYVIVLALTVMAVYWQISKIFSRPGRSQELLYKHLCYSLTD